LLLPAALLGHYRLIEIAQKKATLIAQDVLGFDIPVTNAFLLENPQSGEHLEHKTFDLMDRKRR